MEKMNITYISKSELSSYSEICPELKFTYKGRKSKKSKVSWHTPNVLDRGICIHGQLEDDGYYHIQLLDDHFWGETLVDEIKFKPEINKEYTVYMCKEYPKRIYVTAQYERVKHEASQELKEESRPLRNIFSELTPDHMLQLVRLSHPQGIRSKTFSEFALETSN